MLKANKMLIQWQIFSLILMILVMANNLLMIFKKIIWIIMKIINNIKIKC